MLVTLFGIEISVKLPQPENAEPPMLVTLFGIEISVRLLQPENAASLIVVTLSGIVTFVKFVQLLKKFAGMLLPPVMMTSFKLVGMPLEFCPRIGMVIFMRLLHPENT